MADFFDGKILPLELYTGLSECAFIALWHPKNLLGLYESSYGYIFNIFFQLNTRPMCYMREALTYVRDHKLT